jgi:hypothetical protein
MVRRIALVLALASFAVAGPTLADTASAPGTKVYFIGLKDGDTVGPTLTVRFGLKGMGVAPAGVDFANTGHHHLVVDAPTPPLNDYLPTDNPKILHFGKGQTETELKLEPGKHTLQLVFADQDHKPHNPPVVSERITITVK